MVHIRLLGDVTVAGAPRHAVRVTRRGPALLLARLAIEPGKRWGRVALARPLWPTASDSQNDLRVALCQLRTLLGEAGAEENALEADARAVALDSRCVASDVAIFDQALRRADTCSEPRERTRHLLTAVETYGGDLLPGRDEGWVRRERRRLRESRECAFWLLRAALALR
ncbi:MAG: hypothetical protein IT208_07420 [Chthonomonadales bacterium]|nr:hypothetical protein [Chthonomonadales bacterium]